jgi:hypothetical protein
MCVKMDPLSTLKKIREIIRNTTDRDLVKIILDLQRDVFATESHNLKLVSELASLKRRLDLLARMHTYPPFGYYFQHGDDVPFCPNCWERRGDAIHLPASELLGGRRRRECRVCKETYWEPAIAEGRSRAHHA